MTNVNCTLFSCAKWWREKVRHIFLETHLDGKISPNIQNFMPTLTSPQHSSAYFNCLFGYLYREYYDVEPPSFELRTFMLTVCVSGSVCCVCAYFVYTSGATLILKWRRISNASHLLHAKSFNSIANILTKSQHSMKYECFVPSASQSLSLAHCVSEGIWAVLPTNFLFTYISFHATCTARARCRNNGQKSWVKNSEYCK